jgi:hypothetical protein
MCQIICERSECCPHKKHLEYTVTCTHAQTAGRKNGCIYGRADSISFKGKTRENCKRRKRYGMKGALMEWLKGAKVSRLINRVRKRG